MVALKSHLRDALKKQKVRSPATRDPSFPFFLPFEG